MESCTCSYCSRNNKPTIRIKSASSCDKRKKLIELGHLIKGVPTKTKGASFVENNTRTRKPGPIEKEFKLKELGKMIRGTG
jgi:hypothetical protein